MIIQETTAVDKLERYAKSYHGIRKEKTFTINYCVHYPVWLALTGQMRELEDQILEGAPVMGVNEEIYNMMYEERASQPQMLNKSVPELEEEIQRYAEDQNGWEWSFASLECCNLRDFVEEWQCHNLFYTTVDAAICAEDLDMLRMLLRYGAVLNRDNSVVQKMLLLSGNQALNAYVAEYWSDRQMAAY